MPGITMPLIIGRPRSREAVAATQAAGGVLGVLAQHDADTDRPGPDELYRVGTAGRILNSKTRPDGVVEIVLRGEWRFRVLEFQAFDPHIRARVCEVPDSAPTDTVSAAGLKALRDAAKRFVAVSAAGAPESMLRLIDSVSGPEPLCGILATALPMDHPTRQGLLEERDPARRVTVLRNLLEHEAAVAEEAARIGDETRAAVTDEDRRRYLEAQRDELRDQLAELSPDAGDLERLTEKIRKADLPPEPRAEAERQLARLARIPPGSPEYGVVETWLDWVAALPWRACSRERTDLRRAQRVLERNHYDLERVKERIVEHLAARKLNARAAGVILCLVGPPGVGKTSLGRSIAEATGRKLGRISLGGVHDEAEIRGHRRTYVGALPGRILRVLRDVGTRNPVLVLDEVDKLSATIFGDPTSALLEVLDPEQNREFVDHYLDLPFDLSRIFFLATANTDLTIPPVLLDRMEVIHLPGYTPEEKFLIARRYLLPRQLKRTGLTRKQLKLKPDALRLLIDQYGIEAGVRSLERNIEGICRRVARRVVEGLLDRVVVDARTAETILGPPPHHLRPRERRPRPGLVSTPVITETGADLVTIEVFLTDGKGRLHVTGVPGDEARESVRIALSHACALAATLGIPPCLFQENDLHVHLTASQPLRDTTSCGLPAFLALVGRALDRPVPQDTALMGELTLHGRVLPVEGLRERLVCARRYGFEAVLMPARNAPDLDDVPPEILKALNVRSVHNSAAALEQTFKDLPVPLPAVP
jgi:ATP-dependent Lon protease